MHGHLRSTFLLAVMLVGAACASLSGQKAHELVDAGAVLVDVRSPEEFAQGHIDGALNIPIGELEQRMGELPKEKDIVLYCRSGARSSRGRSMLTNAGYAKVHNLGAMSNWR